MKQKKIAVLLSRFPYPIDKGDRLRAFFQIKYLAQHHEIYLFATYENRPTEDELKVISKYCKQIHLYPLRKYEIALQVIRSFLSGLPVQGLYFYSTRIANKFHYDLSKYSIDTLYVQLSRCAFYAKDLKIRKVLDFQDAFAKNYERIQAQSNGFRKWFYHRESITMKRFEADILSWFDATTIISEFDKKNLSVQPNDTVVVGNGVDFSKFSPRNTEKHCDILFTGNLNYLPNQLALQFLLKEIFPRLVQEKPDIVLQITGGVPKGYQSLHEAFPNNLKFDGWIEDIREAYAQTKLFVAPLFTGAGVQNKILEAMSMCVPCITTMVVNASLNAIPTKEIWIASTAEEFKETILMLLHKVELREQTSQNAKQFLNNNFSWDVNSKKLKELL